MKKKIRKVLNIGEEILFKILLCSAMLFAIVASLYGVIFIARVLSVFYWPR